jgi:hypothetical protein
LASQILNVRRQNYRYCVVRLIGLVQMSVVSTMVQVRVCYERCCHRANRQSCRRRVSRRNCLDVVHRHQV